MKPSGGSTKLEDSHAQLIGAYLGYRAAREPVAAARVAILLARDYLDIYGNFSAYNGWLARPDTLLAEADACAEEGWLLLARVRVPTADALVQNAKDARRIARVTGDTDLEIVALAYSGMGLIWLGRCKQGMILSAPKTRSRSCHPLSLILVNQSTQDIAPEHSPR